MKINAPQTRDLTFAQVKPGQVFRVQTQEHTGTGLYLKLDSSNCSDPPRFNAVNLVNHQGVHFADTYEGLEVFPKATVNLLG